MSEEFEKYEFDVREQEESDMWDEVSDESVEIVEENEIQLTLYEITHDRMIDILAKLRRLVGYSNEEVGEIIGKTGSSVSTKFSQKTLTEEDMAKICYHMGIPFFVLVMIAEKDYSWGSDMKQAIESTEYYINRKLSSLITGTLI